jgi:hypothetical protein
MTGKWMRTAKFGAMAAVLVVTAACGNGSSVTGPDVAAAKAGVDSQPRDSRYTLAYPDNFKAVSGRPDFSRYTLGYPND